jgi:hypothetical protein
MGDVIPCPASFAPDIVEQPARRLELSPAAAELLAQVAHGRGVTVAPRQLYPHPVSVQHPTAIDTTGQPVQVHVTVVNHVQTDARAVAVARTETYDDGAGWWVGAMFVSVLAVAVLAIVLLSAGAWFQR